MIVTGVNRRSCEGECALYNTLFEVTAFFKQQEEGAASCKPIQRAAVCAADEKMVQMYVDGVLSAMHFCVAEDESSMAMPANTL